MTDNNVSDITNAISIIKHALGCLEWHESLQEKIEDFEEAFEKERKHHYYG